MLVAVYDDPTPTNNKIYVLQKKNDLLSDNNNWEVLSGEGVGGGHVLLDKDGVELSERTYLKGEGYIEHYNPSGEAFTATRIDPTKIIPVYSVPSAAQALLEDPLNWDSGGNYIGAAPVDCKAGMKHKDATWVYEFFTALLPIRYPRTGETLWEPDGTGYVKPVDSAMVKGAVIAVDPTLFTGNLDETITDVQKLAQAVDELVVPSGDEDNDQSGETLIKASIAEINAGLNDDKYITPAGIEGSAYMRIHIGPTAPADTSMLWLDTST